MIRRGEARKRCTYLTFGLWEAILRFRSAIQVFCRHGEAGDSYVGCADVAQSAEHRPCKSRVAGSIPAVGFWVGRSQLRQTLHFEIWAGTQVAKGG